MCVYIYIERERESYRDMCFNIPSAQDGLPVPREEARRVPEGEGRARRSIV